MVSDDSGYFLFAGQQQTVDLAVFHSESLASILDGSPIASAAPLIVINCASLYRIY